MLGLFNFKKYRYVSARQMRDTKSYLLEMTGILIVRLKNFRISVFNKYFFFQVQ